MNLNSFLSLTEKQRLSDLLLANIKNRLPDLEKLLAEVNDDSIYEGLIYRFYSGSFKKAALQNTTERIVQVLQSLKPQELPFCPTFSDILRSSRDPATSNSRQTEEESEPSRPLPEAFFHARFFLEMCIKYGKELDKSPEMLPYGWAALLCLYNLI